jgi:hypothetical protein
MMEAISSSETSVLTRATQCNIPEDAILHCHRCENLKNSVALSPRANYTDWSTGENLKPYKNVINLEGYETKCL